MPNPTPQWVLALRAVCGRQRDYFIEAIRDLEHETIGRQNMDHIEVTDSRSAEKITPASDDGSRDEAQTICKLLRAIAGGENAKTIKHDIIFGAAANLIENLVSVQGDNWIEIAALTKRIATLEAALEECLEYFKDRYDVVDGSYGEPAPNKEMQLGSMIEEALYGPGAVR